MQGKQRPLGSVTSLTGPCQALNTPYHIHVKLDALVWANTLCRVYAVSLYFIYFIVLFTMNRYVALNSYIYKSYTSFYNWTYLSCIVIKIAYVNTGNPGEHFSSKREHGRKKWRVPEKVERDDAGPEWCFRETTDGQPVWAQE